MIFRGWKNYDLDSGMVTTELSMTVPGQAMSIKDSIDRYSRDQMLQNFVPGYDSSLIDPEGAIQGFPEFTIPDWSKMDHFERLHGAARLRDFFARRANEGQGPEVPAADPVAPKAAVKKTDSSPEQSSNE